MIHIRSGPNTVMCRGRGGYRTNDLWRATCKKCLEIVQEVIYLEELRRKA